MENWLDKYDVGGPVIKTDATRVAAPTVRFTKKQLEESKAKAKQVTEITNKANAKKLAERKKAVAESSDASIINPNGKRFAIGDKFRLFPNDVSGVGEVFDNFINPFVFTGNTASALGNAMIDRDPKALAIEAGMALGAGALGFDPLGGAMKLPGKLDKAIYPTRTYRSVVPGGNKLSYESSELADKVFSKGDWTTKDLKEAYEYLRGLEVEGGRRGLLTGNDMLFTEYKVPFWKKSVAYDPDVIALKNLQNDVPNPNEFIIPNNKFLYPRRTNLIKAVPQHVKEATHLTPVGVELRSYNPETIPIAPSSSQYASPAYKYVEDQLNAVTGQQMPRTFTLDQLRADAIPMENWQQPQFAPNEGMGSFSPFENGGHLDKYEDGGLINYNDYSVSGPEGFQGEGYSNVGRNYSPAWGGQFAMGGSMPGAVGFTYARTQNPAPSNGPYAKKTKASAEDGGNFPGKWTGNLRDIWNANKSARDFNLQYTQSPNFKNLLKKQGYTDAEIKQRHQAVVDLDASRTSYNAPEYNNVNPDIFGVERLEYNPKGLGDWANWGDIAAHEWGHVGVTGDGPLALKPAEQKLLTERLNWANVSGDPNARAHDVAPQENRADLVELRKALQDRKIYDSFKGGEFKQEHLDKLYRQDPEYWNRTMRLYKDKDIIKLMNTIAANNPQQGVPMAQNGMEMKFYQDGLDFKPKSMKQGGQLTKLDQLTNFTNYNTKQPGGWLDKYK